MQLCAGGAGLQLDEFRGVSGFGGIGSVPGAVVGAFIIGICENIIKGLDVILIKAGLSKQMLGLTTFSDAFTFALLIVILIVKPTGLFGEKTTDKV